MHRGDTTSSTRARLALTVRKLVVVIAIPALLAVAGCGGSSGKTKSGQNAAGQNSSGGTGTGQQPASRGGTLRFAVNHEPLTLDPQRTTENGSGWTMYSLFDQLVEYMPGSPDPKPGLAESWTQSPDGLHYSFKLRDAKFSNGQPVTAADVKFSLQRFTTSTQCGTSYALPIKAIRVVDPHTIGIDLKAPKPGLLYYLGASCASVVPKATLQALGEKKFAKHPVGSGPFMLKRWLHGQELDLVRNPNYWQAGAPYLDGVRFLYIVDDSARILKLRSGGADIAGPIPFSQIDAVDAQNGSQVQTNPFTGLEELFFNVTKKPLDEKAVREALSYATPKDAIDKVVFAAKADLANSQIPRTKYWDKAVPAYSYDTAKAKALLAKSSVPKGFDLTVLTTKDSASTQLATILQPAWARIGVKLHQQLVDPATLYDRFGKRNYEAVLPPVGDVTADLPIDDQFVGLWLGTFKDWTGYSDREVTKLGNSALKTVDDGPRRTMFEQVQRHMMDDAPALPIVFLPSVYGVADGVRGFTPLIGGWWRLERVSLAR
jgi:peptide/nickel transport system substrate-binding protein